jgi:hypothetical protein
VLEFDLVFPTCLTQQQKLLLKASLYLPVKPDEVQAKALRSFEAAFKDTVHGWSTGVIENGDAVLRVNGSGNVTACKLDEAR